MILLLNHFSQVDDFLLLFIQNLIFVFQVDLEFFKLGSQFFQQRGFGLYFVEHHLYLSIFWLIYMGEGLNFLLQKLSVEILKFGGKILCLLNLLFKSSWEFFVLILKVVVLLFVLCELSL